MNVKMAPLVLCVLLSYCVAQSAGGSVNHDTMSERDNTAEGMRKDKALDRIRRMEVPAAKHGQVEDMTRTTESVGKLISARQRRAVSGKLKNEVSNLNEEIIKATEKLNATLLKKNQKQQKPLIDEDSGIKPLTDQVAEFEEGAESEAELLLPGRHKKNTVKKQVQIGNFQVTLELIDLRHKMKPK